MFDDLMGSDSDEASEEEIAPPKEEITISESTLLVSIIG
jgi:hypothetical protein